MTERKSAMFRPPAQPSWAVARCEPMADESRLPVVL
jgi:hypothetical protein